MKAVSDLSLLLLVLMAVFVSQANISAADWCKQSRFTWNDREIDKSAIVGSNFFRTQKLCSVKITFQNPEESLLFFQQCKAVTKSGSINIVYVDLLSYGYRGSKGMRLTETDATKVIKIHSTDKIWKVAIIYEVKGKYSCSYTTSVLH